MAKEWILNSAMNRFQLNFKRNVGATSESIRNCQPKILKEWQDYYFSKVRSKEHIIGLGEKLYIKITEIIQLEVDEITQKDCVDYMLNMVIDRTYMGYTTEIKTIYGQLEQKLGYKIEPAPDDWDRLYNVDFFIKIQDKYIGIQIKPANDGAQLPQIFKEKSIQKNAHKKFTQKYGGCVFYVFSQAKEKTKKIVNTEIVDEIKNEISRLNKLKKR
jgi:hypothetical protein